MCTVETLLEGLVGAHISNPAASSNQPAPRKLSLMSRKKAGYREMVANQVRINCPVCASTASLRMAEVSNRTAILNNKYRMLGIGISQRHVEGLWYVSRDVAIEQDPEVFGESQFRWVVLGAFRSIGIIIEHEGSTYVAVGRFTYAPSGVEAQLPSPVFGSSGYLSALPGGLLPIVCYMLRKSKDARVTPQLLAEKLPLFRFIPIEQIEDVLNVVVDTSCGLLQYLEGEIGLSELGSQIILDKPLSPQQNFQFHSMSTPTGLDAVVNVGQVVEAFVEKASGCFPSQSNPVTLFRNLVELLHRCVSVLGAKKHTTLAPPDQIRLVRILDAAHSSGFLAAICLAHKHPVLSGLHASTLLLCRDQGVGYFTSGNILSALDALWKADATAMQKLTPSSVSSLFQALHQQADGDLLDDLLQDTEVDEEITCGVCGIIGHATQSPKCPVLLQTLYGNALTKSLLVEAGLASQAARANNKLLVEKQPFSWFVKGALAVLKESSLYSNHRGVAAVHALIIKQASTLKNVYALRTAFDEACVAEGLDGSVASIDTWLILKGELAGCATAGDKRNR